MDKEYMAFCETVRQETHRIASLILAGRTQDASVKALALCTEATTRREQYLMQREAETANEARYDLKNLPPIDAGEAG